MKSTFAPVFNVSIDPSRQKFLQPQAKCIPMVHVTVFTTGLVRIEQNSSPHRPLQVQKAYIMHRNRAAAPAFAHQHRVNSDARNPQAPGYVAQRTAGKVTADDSMD